MNRHYSVALTTTILLAGAILLGCGPDLRYNKNPGTAGTGAEVADIKLRNVYVLPPTDGMHERGDQARALLTLHNDGERRDELVQVTSRYAARITVRWDRGCDGQAEAVAQLPLTANGTVPASQTQQRVAHPPYYLEIQDFTRNLRTGTTMPLSFQFQRSGSVTVDALVKPAGRPDTVGHYSCGVLDDLPGLDPSRPR